LTIKEYCGVQFQFDVNTYLVLNKDDLVN